MEDRVLVNGDGHCDPGILFERFTERARHALILARDEAQAVPNDSVGTEHILLGLLGEHDDAAANVLRSLGITLDRAREQLPRSIAPASQPGAVIPFTAGAKRTLELALREGLSLGQNYIGTEHILLALARECATGLADSSERGAAHVLLELGADPEQIRHGVIEMLANGRTIREPSASPAAARRQRHSTDQDWLRELSLVLQRMVKDVRDTLDREPDTGDLLLALACAHDSRAAQILHQLEISTEHLRMTSDTIRARSAPTEQAVPRNPDRLDASKVIQEFRRLTNIPGSRNDPPRE